MHNLNSKIVGVKEYKSFGFDDRRENPKIRYIRVSKTLVIIRIT